MAPLRPPDQLAMTAFAICAALALLVGVVGFVTLRRLDDRISQFARRVDTLAAEHAELARRVIRRFGP